MSWGSWGWDVLSSVASTTTQIVTDLAEAIDVPEGTETNPEKKPISEGETPEPNSEPKSETTPAPQETMEFNSPLMSLFVGKKSDSTQTTQPTGDGPDSVLSFLSSGADYFNNTLQKGVESLQNAEMETFTNMLNPITDAGFGALESLGAAALSVLTTEEGPPEKPRKKPIWIPVIDEDEPEAGTETKPVTNAETPNAGKGKSHMESLEHHSIECMMRTQKLYHKQDIDSRDAIDDLIGKIQDIFDEEHKDLALPSIKLNQTTNDHWESLLQSFETAKKNLSEEETKAITAIKEEKEGDRVLNLSSATNQSLDSIHALCLTTLGDLTTQNIHHFLMVCESFEAEKETTEVTERTLYVCAVTEYFEKELNSISAAFIASLEKITQETQTAIDAVPADDGLTDDSDKAEIKSGLTKKVNGFRNKIHVAVSKGISNIQEARKFLQHVCKFLAVLNNQTEEKPKETEPPKEEPKPDVPQDPTPAQENN